MKRKKLFSLFALIVLLSACNPSIDDIEKSITLEVVNDTVSPTGLTLTINNSSFNSFIYGVDFDLSQEVLGQWVNVPMVTEEKLDILIGYQLPPISEKTEMIDWEKWYGALVPGHYRIGIEFASSKDQYIKDTISIEFEING